MRRRPTRTAAPAPPDGGRRGGWLGRLRLGRDGATAVEMAFLLPVFLMMLLGIEEFGRALWTQMALQFAVQAAARCAAITPSNCTAPGGTAINVPAYAASKAFGLSIPSSDFTYTANATCGVPSSPTGSGGALVTAAYTFRSVVARLIPPLASVTLHARSCHP